MAARKSLQKKKESLGWIPGARSPQLLLCHSLQQSWPIFTGRMFLFSREDESELLGNLPELHDLPSPEDFRSFAE